jgi:hypothetical protein
LQGNRFWSGLVVVQTEDKQACSNFQYKQVPSEARHAGKRRFSIFHFKKKSFEFFFSFFNARGDSKNQNARKYQGVIYGRNESC